MAGWVGTSDLAEVGSTPILFTRRGGAGAYTVAIRTRVKAEGRHKRTATAYDDTTAEQPTPNQDSLDSLTTVRMDAIDGRTIYQVAVAHF